MSDNWYCQKCGSRLLEAGGNCNLHTVRAIPNPPTPKFSDSFKKPVPLTDKQLEAKKKRAALLKDMDLNKLLSKMSYPKDRPGLERTVRGTSSAVFKEGERPASGLTVKGFEDSVSEEVMGRIMELADEGANKNEIMEALEHEFGDEIKTYKDEMSKMVMRTMRRMRAKNAEDGVSDEMDLLEVPPEEDEDEDSPYPQRPDAPPLMKGGKFGMPDLPVGGTGYPRPRRKEDEEDEEKSWLIPTRAMNRLMRQLKSKSVVNLGGGKTVSFNWLIENAARDFEFQGMDERLTSAAILEKCYNAGYFPEDTLSNKANIYVGKHLPALIDMMIEGSSYN